jgi:hypothetical protein
MICSISPDTYLDALLKIPLSCANLAPVSRKRCWHGAIPQIGIPLAAIYENMEPTSPGDEFSSAPARAPLVSQAQREAEIQRLAGEIGRLIRDCDPETREELAHTADILLREEGLRPSFVTAGNKPIATQQRPLNPLAGGIALMLIGGAIALLLPLVGLALAACGALTTLWGIVISARRK